MACVFLSLSLCDTVLLLVVIGHAILHNLPPLDDAEMDTFLTNDSDAAAIA